VEEARWNVWHAPVALVPYTYVRAVELAGGRPLVVPPSTDAVEETLDALDGLVLSGGSDVGPALYGADAHPETQNVRPDRDRAELALLEAALERDLPVLAICRGIEVLNVARGGDLVQHLPDVIGHEEHKLEPGVFGDHEVRLAPESRAGRLLGERAPVKSHHHQGPGRLGDGLVPFAWADDGTIEGLEAADRSFVVGVLWHPEAGEDIGLFRGLVEEARAYREARRG
jgi:gamma-glutamyl-gamma-aminobutyrate hydrolase PuuD